MSTAIADAVCSTRRRLRWAKFFRGVSAILFVAPLVGYLLWMAFLMRTAHHPDSGFTIAGLMFYGLIWSPLLLLPLASWVIFSRRCRILRERLSLLPTNFHESETA